MVAIAACTSRSFKEVFRMIRATKILGFLVALLLLIPLAALGSASGERVFDNAGLFTSTQKREINEAITKFQQDTGMDFVVLTTRQATGTDPQTYAEDYYDYNGFGLDGEHSGVIYYIDMEERWHHIVSTGIMQDYMTDGRIQSAINKTTSSLSSSNYSTAVLTMVDTVRGYIRSGIPEGQYRYDIVTGERLTARHKALTANELLISGVIALAVGIVFIVGVRRSYQLKGSTYQYVFRENCDLTMTDTDDTYQRSTTTQVRKPDPPSGGGSGGGGFGGGGGSGVHTGSSGRSHGGGGGRF